MLELIRFKYTEQGTQGILLYRDYYCFTLELPYKDNIRNLSCIPCGIYPITKYKSNRFGNCFYIHEVKGRSGILIHSGNFAGDIEKGYRTHSQGCILVGKYFGYLENQLAVLNSRITLKYLYSIVEEEKTKIKIFDAGGK